MAEEEFRRKFVEKQLEAIGYDEKSNSKLPVLEMFKTIQGEGIFIGTPSVFVRFAVCNLACVWCDTKYSWVAELLKNEKIKWYSVRELCLAVDDLAGGAIKNVVFTGGEPLLWWGRGLKDVVEMLGSAGYLIEIETNGTVMPKGCMDMPFLRFNVSFKLSNNVANKYEERIRKDVLKYFNDVGETSSVFFDRVSWKIVIKNREDLKELNDIIDSLKLDRRHLVIMPEMTDASKLSEYGWLVDWCVENGVRFISRLHIELWGNKRER
mgnify:CR=1 FL=1